jgi:hypothetical protein
LADISSASLVDPIEITAAMRRVYPARTLFLSAISRLILVAGRFDSPLSWGRARQFAAAGFSHSGISQKTGVAP